MNSRAQDEQPHETAIMKIVASSAGVVIGVSLLAMILGISSKAYSILTWAVLPSPQEIVNKITQVPTKTAPPPSLAPQPSVASPIPQQIPEQAGSVKQLTGSSRQPANIAENQRVHSAETPAHPVVPVQMRIVAKAYQGSWIDACSDGRIVLRKYLPQGGSVNLRFSNGAVIRMGNTGGVEISINGKPTGPLGRMGQIRVVQFDEKGFRVLNPNDPGAECGRL
jgi:cytoskeleton protein RodZ